MGGASLVAYKQIDRPDFAGDRHLATDRNFAPIHNTDPKPRIYNKKRKELPRPNGRTAPFPLFVR